MLALLSLIALPTTAVAAPQTLNHQGRLLDAAGDPITGEHRLSVSLYDASDADIWNETLDPVTFTSGYFSVSLGELNPFAADVLNSAISIGLSLDDGPALPVQPLHSAPYALIATHVRGGQVDATDLSINGTPVINANGEYVGTVPWVSLSGVPADADTVGQLACSSDEVATFTGVAWTCASNSAHTHIASQVQGGTLDYTVLPFGTGPNQIAHGDHVHADGNAQTLDALDSTDFARASHSHTLADLKALPTAGGALTGSLSGTSARFSGTVTVGDGGTTSNCNQAGQLRWNSGLQVCNGTQWTVITTLAGQSQSAAALSCADILAQDNTATSGVYWLNPTGGAAFEAYCDMTTDGGGWTLVLNYLQQAGTNPGLAVLTQSLPLPTGAGLGTDESANASSWGHAGNALMSTLSFTETQWYCETAAHPRVIHFKTTGSDVVSYLKTGVGTMTSEYDPAQTTDLARYANATLPLHTNPEMSHYADQGDYAMTAFPFYSDSAIGNPRAHWGIRGLTNRWECDDYGINSDTHFQIFIR